MKGNQMSLVNTFELLKRAQSEGYAVPAFNFENMEMALAIVRACERMKSPVILQTTTSTIKFASDEMYAAIGRAAAESVSVPVAVHLDHGASFEVASSAIGAGYTSVMIDGSALDFEGNVAVTKKTVELAHASDIPVEAELGRVGGKEDDVSCDEDIYTSPSMALEFVKRTGCDSLAVAIGTAHGVYKTKPVLYVNRLSKIKYALKNGGYDIPLVLHGASGLTEDDVRSCIKEGICKVNFATELRQAYTNGIRAALANDASVYDPKKFNAVGMKSLDEAVVVRILVCMSDGKFCEQI